MSSTSKPPHPSLPLSPNSGLVFCIFLDHSLPRGSSRISYQVSTPYSSDSSNLRVPWLPCLVTPRLLFYHFPPVDHHHSSSSASAPLKSCLPVPQSPCRNRFSTSHPELRGFSVQQTILLIFPKQKHPHTSSATKHRRTVHVLIQPWEAREPV
jgi:hypothetical protein